MKSDDIYIQLAAFSAGASIGFLFVSLMKRVLERNNHV